MQHVVLDIEGMSCGHCVRAVDAALESIPGVAAREVAIGSARIAVDPSAGSADQVAAAAVEAIRDAGYDAAVAAGPA